MNSAPRVVEAALARFPIRYDRVTELSESFNTVYRVDAGSDRFVLRVGRNQRIHAPDAAEAEAAWTDELAAAGLAVPRVVRTVDGAASAAIGGDGMGERQCMLLTWTDGESPARPIHEADARGLGLISAGLHLVSSERPDRPSGVLDGLTVLHFNVANGLGELDREYGALFREAYRVAAQAIHRLCDAGHPRIIHGDLTAANTIRTDAGLVPIDFQDITWGHVERDIANTLYSIAQDDGDGSLAAAFRTAYETVRPWPALDERLLDGLFLVRRLSMVNLALTLRRPGLMEYLRRHADALRGILG
jgi:Ser/Thr protein kinase RdoA (MazF antagonist)